MEASLDDIRACNEASVCASVVDAILLASIVDDDVYNLSLTRFSSKGCFWIQSAVILNEIIRCTYR